MCSIILPGEWYKAVSLEFEQIALREYLLLNLTRLRLRFFLSSELRPVLLTQLSRVLIRLFLLRDYYHYSRFERSNDIFETNWRKFAKCLFFANDYRVLFNEDILLCLSALDFSLIYNIEFPNVIPSGLPVRKREKEREGGEVGR